MKTRGGTIALLTVALGVALLISIGFASRRRLLEEWYTHKLKTGDEDARKTAAEKLGDMGSAVGIPFLVRAAKSDPSFAVRRVAMDSFFKMPTETACKAALQGISIGGCTEEEYVRVLAEPFIQAFKDLGVMDYLKNPKTFVDLVTIHQRLIDVAKSIRTERGSNK